MSNKLATENKRIIEHVGEDAEASRIVKIVVKSTSGFGPINQAYNDKITITPESISYEYKPYEETDANPKRKWSYKTNSALFKKQYEEIEAVIPMALNDGPFDIVYDIGTIEFLLTFSDKTKYRQLVYNTGDCYEGLFKMIKKLVPGTEQTPSVLITSEAYDDVSI